MPLFTLSPNFFSLFFSAPLSLPGALHIFLSFLFLFVRVVADLLNPCWPPCYHHRRRTWTCLKPQIMTADRCYDKKASLCYVPFQSSVFLLMEIVFVYLLLLFFPTFQSLKVITQANRNAAHLRHNFLFCSFVSFHFPSETIEVHLWHSHSDSKNGRYNSWETRNVVKKKVVVKSRHEIVRG